MRAARTNKAQWAAAVCARLNDHVALEADASGKLIACLEGGAIGLGTFGAATVGRARDLRDGLPLVC